MVCFYSLAEGQGRLRANREGNVKTHHFGSSVISTAEQRFLKMLVQMMV